MISIDRVCDLADMAAEEPSTGIQKLDDLYRRCSEWGWGGIRSPYYIFLYFLARDVYDQSPGGQCLVELGAAQGLGTIMMAGGAPGDRAIAVDWRKPGFFVEDLPFDNYEHWQMDTVEAADHFRDLGLNRSVKLIFIDSTHTRDHARRELDAWRPNFSDTCILVADDIIDADNNTDLPGWWREDVPGEKVLFPDTLHRPDNCIGVSIITR